MTAAPGRRPGRAMKWPGMSDLYDSDILAWSEAQADRLRRVAAGERVNDVDWEHVIEEIGDVGKSELRAAKDLLFRAIEHSMKLRAMPDNAAAEHWRDEAANFLRQAQDAYMPSMAAKIDPAALWRRARRQVLFGYKLPPDALPEAPPPDVTLTVLMDPEADPLGLLPGQ
jgi:hypothetical protein